MTGEWIHDRAPEEHALVMVRDDEENPDKEFLCRYEEGYYNVVPSGGVFKPHEITCWKYYKDEAQ